jgi:hypothetical protein
MVSLGPDAAAVTARLAFAARFRHLLLPKRSPKCLRAGGMQVGLRCFGAGSIVPWVCSKLTFATGCQVQPMRGPGSKGRFRCWANSQSEVCWYVKNLAAGIYWAVCPVCKLGACRVAPPYAVPQVQRSRTLKITHNK